MIVRHTKKFEREYKKLPLKVKIKAESKENLFRKNPFSTNLKTHKLSGELEDLWSFSVDHRHRIIFEFIGDVVYFHSIGTHDIYR